jgi:muramoyltetrapeptide carboxypeptidase
MCLIFLLSNLVWRIFDAFADKKIKAILTTIGGCNSIHLLKELDYELIKNNPKILCGYSDITTLQNAIFAKTGLVTYSGPHFSTFGCLKGIDYIIDCFQKCLFDGSKEIPLFSSSSWSDDEWYLDQEKRKFLPNLGLAAIHSGETSGTIVGGNIDSFNVLQGTEYMPSLKETVLFLEDNYPMTADILDRHIHSLILQTDFQYVKGIVLGRFQVDSKITVNLLQKIVDSKKELKDMPVIAEADFGHTLPLFTFPIGGDVRLESKPAAVKLTLTKR